MKCSVEEKNQEIALLTIANNRYHDKIAHLEREIEKRDEIIAGLRANERTLEKDKMRLYDQEKVWGHGAVEYENFKRDLKRLMQMLKTTAEYREFANLAIADGGVRFLH
jgi:peptidoglycan hydrolase CwlO-like protein